MFTPLVDENRANGLPVGTTTPQQAGSTDIDAGTTPEAGINLPWMKDPSISWLDYQCTLEVVLDAGQALHKCLPQESFPVDSLGDDDVGKPAAMLASKNGVNLVSRGKGKDVIQAMATSTYTFRLRGYGVRAGYPVPVPRLVTIGGVPAVPAQRQWASLPQIVANAMGVPIFLGQWDLWYYVAMPPGQNQIGPANLAEHSDGSGKLPDGMQVPVSQSDQNSIVGGQAQLQGFFTGSK